MLQQSPASGAGGQSSASYPMDRRILITLKHLNSHNCFQSIMYVFVYSWGMFSLTRDLSPMNDLFLRLPMVLLAEPSLLWTYINSMLAPRRPDTPVLVPKRHLIRKNNLKLNEELNGPRRKGMVEGDGGRREQPQEMMKGNVGPESSTGRKPPSPTTLVPQLALQSATIYNIPVRATTTPALVPEGGTRVEIETLSLQDQNKPNFDEQQVETQPLPGVNQDTSNMGEVPKPASPSVSANPARPSAAPAITVNKPLPGQNQANPIMGELAPPAPSLLTAPSPPPPPPPQLSSTIPLVHGSTTTWTPSSEATISLTQSVAASTFLPTLTSTLTSTITPSSLFTLSPVISFVTITQSEQGKEVSSLTQALSTSVSSSVTRASANPTDNIASQATAVAQSLTAVSSSTAAISVATIIPTAISSNQVGGILHPTARTLLILFIILGALSVLVAIIVFMLIRSHKRDSQVQQQTTMYKNPYDAPSDRVGVTTHISANPSDNPFLTASEKAIIDRAASPEACNDPSNSSSISDAISSFIEKSRRMTYKISP